ncbi:hypothetical protein MPDQ_005039 [Monascus purpureus]|uniref:Ribosomal protein S36, mitochondrial n=1 Tax=Monascus purpureus TaxID=5098 RepID=A0A507QIK0_MONPU|nr:hypothetical protein MPDQ_005039 [Monascus purpureus]BDD60590.1 hypothetical protein MAP00_005708 [Monascus purpureus]
MQATRALRNAARTPLIHFLGKRTPPTAVDHTPRAHPASPSGILPDSFAAYRSKAQQHGPLGRATFASGAIGGSPGASLGPVEPKQGEYFDRNELPERFHRLPWTEAEIEAIETGGASLFS